MSSYVNFYLRVNDKFAPIGSYSRSTEMYKAVSSQLPYEKIRALTAGDLMLYIRDLENAADNVKIVCERDRSHISLIMNAENTSLDEKLDTVDDIEENCRECEDYISELMFAADTLRVFYNMIDEFKYYNESGFTNDAEHYIYAGIEAYGNLESVVGE